MEVFCIPDAHVIHTVDLEMLKELFSPDLLQLWRTGARLLVFTSGEDTDIDVRLTQCYVYFTIIADIASSRG